MKLSIVSAAIILTLPAFGQPSPVPDAVLLAALNDVPHHFRSVGEPGLWNLCNHQIAIAGTTTGGGQDHLDRYLEEAHSTVIAEELSVAYARVSSAREQLELDTIQGIPILPLARFARDVNGYDWQRLREVYPDVGAVVRVSLPAIDSTQSVAVVRYEVISPNGPSWSSFAQLTRHPDGTWKFDRGVFGNLWD